MVSLKYIDIMRRTAHFFDPIVLGRVMNRSLLDRICLPARPRWLFNEPDTCVRAIFCFEEHLQATNKDLFITLPSTMGSKKCAVRRIMSMYFNETMKSSSHSIPALLRFYPPRAAPSERWLQADAVVSDAGHAHRTSHFAATCRGTGAAARLSCATLQRIAFSCP